MRGILTPGRRLVQPGPQFWRPNASAYLSSDDTAAEPRIYLRDDTAVRQAGIPF